MIRAVFWTTLVSLLVIGTFGTVAVVLTEGWKQATECEPVTKCDKLPFDSTLWKAHGDWSNPVRVKMVDDLVARHGIVGQTRAWIEEQLGTPEATHPFEARCDYVYWLGPARTLVATEFEWLCLRFADDLVVESTLEYSSSLGPS